MKDYDNFFLPVNNLNIAKEYYLKLGLPVKFDFSDKGMAAFNVGNQEPAIILKDTRIFPNASKLFGLRLTMFEQNIKNLRKKGSIFIGTI